MVLSAATNRNKLSNQKEKEEATQDVVLQQTPPCAIIICDIIPATTTLDSWIQKSIGKS